VIWYIWILFGGDR